MSANDKQHGGQHYKRMSIQHWDFVLANGVPYMEAQVIKYLCRWREKNGLEDLWKAQHFLEKLIEWETQQEQTNDPKRLSGTGTKDGV